MADHCWGDFIIFDMKRKGKLLNANELPWEKVDDPINEDGTFYGLMELDNVAVVKVNNKVKFRLHEKSSKDKFNADKPDPQPEEVSVQKKEKKIETYIREVKNDEILPDFGPFESSSEMCDESSDDQALETEESAETQEKRLPELGQTPLLAAQKTADLWPALDKKILSALKELEFLHPTKIQLACIPKALEGIDIIGKAATGSGKTLAYGLPLLEKYVKNGQSEVPCGIVVAPTRELAHQIRDHITAVVLKCGGTQKTVVALTGGLAIQKQLRLLESQPAIIVGTPGRILEILEQMPSTQIALYQKVETFVLDEADRLVRDKSFEELDKIFGVIGQGLHKTRQTMVFSATFESRLWQQLGKHYRKFPDVCSLLQRRLAMRKNTVYIDVDPNEHVATNVVQSIVECSAKDKDAYLYYIVLMYKGKTIVFVNSIDSLKRVVPMLKELGLPAFGVHSDMVQKQRLRSLERFKATDNGILVATDVAARGLDIPHVDHVVHYNLPRTADTYVHRSGRTARAGMSGISIILCSPEEGAHALVRLCRLVNTKPQALDVDLDLLTRLKARVVLAREIAEEEVATIKKGRERSWLESAADELGVSGSIVNRVEDTDRSDITLKRAKLAQLLKKRLVPVSSHITRGSRNIADVLLRDPDVLLPHKNMHKRALEILKKNNFPS